MNQLRRTPTGNSVLKIQSTPRGLNSGTTPHPPASGTRFLVGALVILIAASVFLTYQVFSLKSNPDLQGQKELERILKKVEKLVVLPLDEVPTLATVTDPEKLKDQPFFANAKAGYKVLLFTKAQKAILYDPVSNRIVEIAPINSGATPITTPTGTDTTTEPTTP